MFTKPLPPFSRMRVNYTEGGRILQFKLSIFPSMNFDIENVREFFDDIPLTFKLTLTMIPTVLASFHLVQARK